MVSRERQDMLRGTKKEVFLEEEMSKQSATWQAGKQKLRFEQRQNKDLKRQVQWVWFRHVKFDVLMANFHRVCQFRRQTGEISKQSVKGQSKPG